MSKAVLGVWTSDPLAALTNPESSRFDAMPIPFTPGACQAEPCLAGVTPALGGSQWYGFMSVCADGSDSAAPARRCDGNAQRVTTPPQS